MSIKSKKTLSKDITHYKDIGDYISHVDHVLADLQKLIHDLTYPESLHIIRAVNESDPYFNLVNAHIDKLKSIRNFALQFQASQTPLSIPADSFLWKNIIKEISNGVSSEEVFKHALDKENELSEEQKRNLTENLGVIAGRVVEQQQNIDEKKRLAFDEDLTSEKALAREEVLAELGVDSLNNIDVPQEDTPEKLKLKEKNPQERFQAFFNPKKNEADKELMDEISFAIGRGHATRPSFKNESVSKISQQKIVKGVAPLYAPAKMVYDKVLSYASNLGKSIGNWFERLFSAAKQLFSKILPAKAEKGELETYLNSHVKKGSRYDTLDADKLSNYLDIRRLLKQADIEGHPSLREIYLKERLKTPKEIQSYLEFEEKYNESPALNTFYESSLQEKLEAIQYISDISLSNYDPRQVQVTLVLDHIKQLENEFLTQYDLETANPKSINSVCATLSQSLNYLRPTFETENNDTDHIRENSLYKTVDKILKSYFEKSVQPLLEKILDQQPRNNGVRTLYSKIANGHVLNRRDISILDKEVKGSNFLTASEKQFSAATLGSILELRKAAETNPDYSASPKIEPAQTAREISVENIQQYVDASKLKSIVEEIRLNIESQKAEMVNLQSYTTPATPLYDACQKKFEYLSALEKAVNSIEQEITDKKVAKMVFNLSIDPQANKIDESFNTSPLSSLLKLIPVDLEKNSSSVEKAIFYQLAARVDAAEIMEAKRNFETTLQDQQNPELLPFLSDPFEYGNFVQNQEAIVEQLLSYVLKQPEVHNILTAAHDLPKEMIKFVAQKVAEEAVSKIPGLSTILSVTLAKILARDEVQTFLIDLIQDKIVSANQGTVNLLTEKLDKISQNAFKRGKEYISKKIGIELRSVMEENALAFINSKKLSTEQKDIARDAFSIFYLQYRALKEQNKDNPDFDKLECAKFLFKSVAIHDIATQRKILSIFDKYDNELYLEERNALGQSDVNSQLNFLLNNLDLSKPENEELMRMTIFNRLLMMQAEALDYNPQVQKRETAALEEKITQQIDQVQNQDSGEKDNLIAELKKSKSILAAIKKSDLTAEAHLSTSDLPTNLGLPASISSGQNTVGTAKKIIHNIQQLKGVAEHDIEARHELGENMAQLKACLDTLKKSPELAAASADIEKKLHENYNFCKEKHVAVSFVLPNEEKACVSRNPAKQGPEIPVKFIRPRASN